MSEVPVILIEYETHSGKQFNDAVHKKTCTDDMDENKYEKEALIMVIGKAMYENLQDGTNKVQPAKKQEEGAGAGVALGKTSGQGRD